MDMSGEKTSISLQETYVIKKYEGDPPAPGESKEPIEVIVIENGKIRIEKPNGSQ